MRDLLLHTHRYRDFGPHVRYAAQLAAAFDAATFTGLYVLPPVLALPTPSGAAVVPELVAFAEQNLDDAMAARDGFLRFAREHGAERARWMVAEGPLADTMGYVGNWHDLLVIECGGESVASAPAAVGQVLLGSGLPCLVVPCAHEAPPRLDTIAVAWNGAPEAVRAVHAALPLLTRARRVVVMAGERSDRVSLIRLQPGFDLSDYLARHGVQAETVALDADDTHAGEALLHHAAEADAGLLVMGAYGRTRFTEWILGGATRYVLQHAALPVLMRH